MSEGYKKLSKINLELVDDFNCVDKEADALLNDY
jgi:hypothetical protein